MASRGKARRLLLTSVDWQTVLVEVGTCPAARRPIGSVSDLTDFVTEQSRNLSIHPSLLATKWFCRKLIDIGTDCYHDNRVIEPSRLEIDNILELGCYLKENSLIDYRCLIDIIQKDIINIGVYILWKLTTENIIHIKDIFNCSNEWHSDTVCTVLANSLIKLSHMIDPPVYRNDLLDDIAIVIMEIYADNNNGGGLWKPTAEKILLEVLDGSYFVSGNPPSESFHSILHASPRLSPIAKERLFTRLLHHFVLLPPLTPVVECYPHQSDYQFSSLSYLKRSLFVTMCKEMESSLCWTTIMDLFKTHKKLNWSVVLSLVACFVHHYSETVTFKDLISDVVQSAFVEATPNLNEPLLYGTMAVARQASLEGTHVFPSYSDWFEQTFSDVPGCVIQNKKDLGCLLKFLTAMVPFDPPYCLRAHLQHHPRKLPKCQLMVKDYCDLVHVRLNELNEPFSELDVNGCDGSIVITELALADADVDEVIKEYESHDCHVIPSKVLELSMFRQPYFVGKFLKSLLAPRKLPGIPDTRAKLISALEKQGTIPLKYMNKYRTECNKITSNDGVTLGESTPPLFSLLVSELQRVSRHINDDAASFKGVLSRLSNCISSTIKDTHRQYSSHRSSTSTVLDLSSPGIQEHMLEIINFIVTNLCECIFKLHTQLSNEDSVPLTHFNSITMFVKMLSGHVTLHRGLLVRLWELVHLQVTELADEQLLSLAVLIAQFYANECSYSTITVKSCYTTFFDSKNIIEVTTSTDYAELLLSSLLHYNHSAMINTGKFLCHMLYHLYTRQYNIESIDNSGRELSYLKQSVTKLQYFQERIGFHQKHVKSTPEDMNGLLKMIAQVLKEFKISSCQANLIMKLQFDFMSQDYLSPLQRHTFRRDMFQSADRNFFANLFCFMLKLTSSRSFCCSAHKEIHNHLIVEGSIGGIQLLLELSPAGLVNVCNEEDHVPLKFLLDFDEIDNEETASRCLNFIQALPPHICYSGSVVELPSEKQLTTFVKIMKRIVTSLCCHGILLPFDLTCHLFKGISQFSFVNSTMFSNRFNYLCDIYPVFHASILFWWNDLKEHVSGSILSIEAFHIFNIAVLDIQRGSIHSSPYLLSHCKAVAICTAGLICTSSSKDISTEKLLQELKLPATSYSQSLLCYLGKCSVNILLKNIPVLYQLTTTAVECPAITVLQYILNVDVSLWVVLLHEEHYASVDKMNQLNQFSKELPMNHPAYQYNLLLLIVLVALSHCNDRIIEKLTHESGFLQKFFIAHRYLFDIEKHCIHMDNFLKSCSVLTRTIIMNASKQKLQDCLPFCHKGLQIYLEDYRLV